MTRTKEEIVKIVNSLGYDLLNEYFDAKRNRRVVVQDRLTYKYDVILSSLRNYKPDIVGVWNPYSLHNIAIYLSTNRPEYKVSGDKYINSEVKLKFYHSICDEYFYMSWNSFYSGGQGCSVCRGLQIGKRNSLAHLRPDLKKEWHPDNILSSTEVTLGHDGKVYWICSKCGYGKNKEWFVSPHSRTSMKSGCSVCANKLKESAIATGLKMFCKNKFKHLCHIEYKMFENPKTNSWLRCDIYLGKSESSNGVYIEIQGRQHYIISSWDYFQAIKNNTSPRKEFEYRKHLDKIKKKFAKKNGTYIEIDLRKIKTTEQAIEYINSIIK